MLKLLRQISKVNGAEETPLGYDGSNAIDLRRLCAFAFTLSALILMLPANLMPFMSFEVYGQKTESTIISGAITLWNSNSKIIALIVLISSFFVPLLKLILLLGIQFPFHNPAVLRKQLALQKIVEVIGPWSMLDIFLISIFVAIVKLGNMGTVNVEPGAFVFLAVVCLTMLASQIFNEKNILRKGIDGV